VRRLSCLLFLLLSFSGDSVVAQVAAHCGELPHGPGLLPSEQGMVDRFNNPWRTHPALVAWQQKRRLQSVDCGGFRIDFEDVILHTGIGFDDHTPVSHPILGSTTLGAVRQRTVCEVFGYISSLIQINGSPDIIIRPSLMQGTGLLGAASPFFKNTSQPYVAGTMYDHITTGVDPTPMPGDYDAMIFFDFNYPDWNNDWNQPSGSRIDLYGVTLHEITHTLGFLSLIGPNGTSDINGAWSLFDRRLRDGSGIPLINLATGTYQASPDALTSSAVTFHGERCDNMEIPVYSPSIYQDGSSMSHFDKNRGGIPYVMNPYAPRGDNRHYTEPELQTLCDLGYTLRGGQCGNCAPIGKIDFATTPSGVEVCIDVLANDIDPDNSGPLVIDLQSVGIESGGGSIRINGEQLCYIPPADYVGVAFLHYAPTDGSRSGSTVTVRVNVTGAPAWPPTGRKDAFIWYFGSNAGVSFTNGVAAPLTDGQLSNLEGSASICSPRDGRLLFYTNGVSVWNASHKVMSQGIGLKGNWTSSQSALIVPNPADTNLFYIFTTNALTENDKTFRYSMVDMRLDNGRGEVTVKNVPLFTNGTEKVGATRHCNGRDYWVITHEWGSNRFYSYLLDATGISDTVISDLGSICPTTNDVQGSIQIAPNGRMVAVSTTGTQVLELFDFDPSTGVLTNARELNRGQNFYGLEFSPNNSKLYYTTLPNPGAPATLVQYDLQAGDLAEIKKSAVELHRETGEWDGSQVQMGPDGRIYVSYYGRALLGVITKPNLKGAAAAYNHNGLDLAGRRTSYGMCNVIDCDVYGVSIGFASSYATIAVSNSTPLIGDTVTYQISVCNGSTVDRTNFDVEFTLPEGVAYLDGMSAYPQHRFFQLSAGACDSFAVRGIVLPSVRYNAKLAACTRILDTVVAGCSATFDDCVDLIVAATNLFLNKTVDRTSAGVGDTLNYKIIVANNGPDSATNITVKDVLPPRLRYVSHTVAAPSSFNSTSGILHIPVIKVGASVVLEVSAVVEDGTDGELIVNCAEIVGLDQTDLDQRDNYSCAETRLVVCLPVLLGVRMDSHTIYEAGRRFLAPVTLTAVPPDSIRLSHFILHIEFDSTVIIVDSSVNPSELLQGTVLEGWSVVRVSRTKGKVFVELQAPPGVWLHKAGVLLQLPMRMYMSATGEISSLLHPGIQVIDNRCVEVIASDGFSRLDSICGLNFRFIQIEMNRKYALYEVHPNPAGDYLGMAFELGLDGETIIELVDLIGRRVATPLHQLLASGRYDLVWDARSIPNGRYALHLRSGDWHAVRTIVVQR